MVAGIDVKNIKVIKDTKGKWYLQFQTINGRFPIGYLEIKEGQPPQIIQDEKDHQKKLDEIERKRAKQRELDEKIAAALKKEREDFERQWDEKAAKLTNDLRQSIEPKKNTVKVSNEMELLGNDNYAEAEDRAKNEKVGSIFDQHSVNVVRVPKKKKAKKTKEQMEEELYAGA